LVLVRSVDHIVKVSVRASLFDSPGDVLCQNGQIFVFEKVCDHEVQQDM